MIYKVVARNLHTRNQWKKKQYISDEDFAKYGTEIIRRWEEYHDIEVYTISSDNKWELKECIESTCKHRCTSCKYKERVYYRPCE